MPTLDVLDLSETFRRAEHADVRAVEGDSRRVTLAVSSEQPCDRWYGEEILAHSADAIDLSFFGGGRAPLLLDHDTREQIGVVERVTLGADKVLRAVVRFSKNARASEILNDINDGIRLNTSVGYRIQEYEALPDDGGYLIKRWKPFEVSIVSIPADESVGVGRSTLTRNSSMTTEPTVAEANKRAAEIVARAEAVADALDIATRHNMRDKMQAFLTPEVRALPATEILAKARTFALANLPDNKPITAPYIHTASDEPDNVMVAIRGLAGFDTRNRSFGAMVERSQELARTYGNPRGMYVPMEAFLPATRATQLASDHPALLPSVSLPGMLVEGLRPYNACLALGAKLLQLGENSYIPGISALNGDWYADDEGAPDQTPVTRSIPLTLHRHTTRVKWGYTLAKIGNPAVDGMTKQQLLASMMGAVDVAAIQGAGTPGDAPKGILNTAGVGVVSLGGGELDWEAIIALQTAIFAEGVTGQQFGFGYLSSHLVREKLLTTLKSTGISGYLMEADTSEPTVAGFKAAFTSNCPNSLIFGNWSDTIVAQFGSPDVVVDPYTESAKGNVAITVHSGWDIGVRHAESFAYIEDALAS